MWLRIGCLRAHGRSARRAQPSMRTDAAVRTLGPSRVPILAATEAFGTGSRNGVGYRPALCGARTSTSASAEPRVAANATAEIPRGAHR